MAWAADRSTAAALKQSGRARFLFPVRLGGAGPAQQEPQAGRQPADAENDQEEPQKEKARRDRERDPRPGAGREQVFQQAGAGKKMQKRVVQRREREKLQRDAAKRGRRAAFHGEEADRDGGVVKIASSRALPSGPPVT